MRLLHTSDWHVGRAFHGRDLLAEQETVLADLAEVVAAERVDVVVVAGDLYDRAMPSAEATRVCSRALWRLREAGAQVVVSSGNHDSAGRLAFGAQFAAAGGLHLCTDPGAVGTPVLFADEHGPVAVYPLPYLEPETARHALGDPALTGHQAVLSAAMDLVRADLATRPAGTRSVVLAHAFVVGGEPSESERDISVGGVASVPVGTFDGVDYVALGHLHGAQTLSDRVRYAGSPLAYSFSEARHHKSAWLVDLEGGGLGTVRRHSLPVARRLSTITGELADLLADRALNEVADHYLSVVLTDPVRPADPMRRLQLRFPHAVHLRWEPAGGAPDGEGTYTARLRGRDDLQVAAAFVEHARGVGAGGSERALLVRALEEVRAGEAAAAGRQR
jgi:exonuclease SbcD